jgi:hypothetical protein
VLASTPRRRSVPSLAGLVAACLASGILVLTVFPSLAAALTGQLNAGPPGAAGQLLIEESNAARSTCSSAVIEDSAGAICSSINAFGSAPALAPGRPHATTLVFTNVGSVPVSSFSVDAGRCSPSRPGRSGVARTDLCDLVSVSITAAGTTVFDGSATDFGSADAIDILGRAGVGPLASGQNIAVTLTLRLSETVDNRYQGLRIAEPISWAFGS